MNVNQFIVNLTSLPRWAPVANYAHRQRLVPPRFEYSLYGPTSDIASQIFPPQQGFLIKVQNRMGNFAHHRAGPAKTHRSSTGTMEAPGTKGSHHPDAVIAWTTYTPESPPPQGVRAEQIPVLVQEIKSAVILNNQPDFDEAEGQMIKYLRRINDKRTGANTQPDARVQHLRDLVTPGVLIFGTRCFRYEPLPLNGPGRLDFWNLDEDGPEIHYYDTVHIAYYDWLYKIKAPFVATLSPQALADPGAFEVAYFQHDVECIIRQSPTYESSLYWLVYRALNVVSATRWGVLFLDRPQSGLREPVPQQAVTALTPRTSLDFPALEQIARIPDFVVILMNPVPPHYDEAKLVVEVKKEDTEQLRREVFEQVRAGMELLYRATGRKIPGLAVMAAKYWRVRWQGDIPTINWPQENGTLTDLRADATIWGN